MQFDISREDSELVWKIVDRAQALLTSMGNFNRMATAMDLTACHANGTSLDLLGILSADDFNFAHDVCGIMRHIDRTTGKLGDCFVPRYARR
jgi:hypothetical protein